MSAQTIDVSIDKLAEASQGQAGELLATAFEGEEFIAKYKSRFNDLKDIRRPMEAKWEQVRDLLDPAATRWLGSGQSGDDAVIDDSKIFDGTPRKMAQTAADGLHGGLSNPGMPWFNFYVGRYDSFDEEISPEGKEWLQLAAECVRDVLAKSNFYLALHSLYRESLEFGCALMIAMRHNKSYVRFYNYTIGSFWVGQNNEREIDTAYIQHRQSARSIVDTYGMDRVPEVVLDALRNKRADEMFTIIQCIQPWNFFGDLKGSHPDFVFEDVRFIDEGNDDDPILYRSGYRTKPFIFARWSESWDFVYPRTCPGIDALPDIRQLYKLTEFYNNAINWGSDPTIIYDAAMDNDMKSFKPGMMIPVSGSGMKTPVQAFMPPVFDVQNNILARGALIEKISAMFYNREIMLITSRAEQNHEMTAFEASLLSQEKNAVLGPVTTRTSHDSLIPSLDRTFELIQNEFDILPEPPSDLVGEDLHPYFTSDMAVTQRQAWINRANEVLMWWQAVAPNNPEVNMFFNWENWAREFERTDMVSSRMLNSRQRIQEMRDQQAQAMQQEQKMAMLERMGGAGKDLGQTPTTGDNAAAELMGGGGLGGQF